MHLTERRVTRRADALPLAEELVKQTISLKPADVQKTMTTQELADVVEYMPSLKKKWSSDVPISVPGRPGSAKDAASILTLFKFHSASTRYKVSERAPWAPITRDCLISAVFEGPEINPANR